MQRLRFQESYWQTVFRGGPPPTIEMIKVVHNSKLVLSMAAGSGQLQFVTDNNKLNIEGTLYMQEISLSFPQLSFLHLETSI